MNSSFALCCLRAEQKPMMGKWKFRYFDEFVSFRYSKYNREFLYVTFDGYWR